MKKCILIMGLVLLVLSQSLIAGAQTGQVSEETFINGIEQYYIGNYSEAVTLFNRSLAENINQIDSLYYQTLTYIELNNVAGARDNMAKLKKLGYNFGKLHWKLGTIYLNKNGQFDSPFYNEAKNELIKANQLGINSARFHSDLAMAYQGLGDLKQAASEYRLALEDGGDAGDYINLASLYKETGQLDRAINTYQQALSFEPDNSSLYLNLGNIYLQKEEYKLAVDILKQAVELNPETIAIRLQLAIAYYRNQDFTRAKSQFNEVIDQNDNIYQAYYYLGEIANKTENNSQQAVYYFNKAIEKNDDYVKAYIALGNLYLKQDNAYKAISQFTTAIEKNPNYPDSHYYLAVAYHQLGMKEAAVAELRKTLHLNNDFSEARKLLDELTKE